MSKENMMEESTKTRLQKLGSMFRRKEQKKRFKIEYYPESDNTYVTYDGYYLKRCYDTGIYGLERSMRFATQFYNEEKAMQAIRIFKEQRTKENIKITEVE